MSDYAEFGFVPDEKTSAKAAADDYSEFGFIPEKKSQKPRNPADIFYKQGFVDPLTPANAKMALDAVDTGLRRSREGLYTATNVRKGIEKLFNKPGFADQAVLDNSRLDEEFKQKYDNSLGSRAIAGAAEIAPLVAGGYRLALNTAPLWLTKAAQTSPKAMQLLAKWGGIAGKNAAFGGITNIASYDPSEEKSRTDKFKEGALLSGILGTGTVAGASALSKAFQPGLLSRIIKPGASKEQIEKNIEDLEGYPSGLGDVIQNPKLKRFQENVLASVPFSGVQRSQMKTAEKIKSETDGILENLKPAKIEEDSNKQLYDNLMDAFDTTRNQKNALYTERNAYADNLKGFKAVGTNLYEEIKKLENSLAKNEFEALVPADVRAEINKLSKIGKQEKYFDIGKDKTLIEKTRTVAPSGTMQEISLAKGTLNDAWLDAKISGNTSKARVLNNLRGAIKKDIDQSITKFGDDKLKSMHNEAEKFYKEDFAPFEEPEIAKFVYKGADPDTLLSSFIKTGVNDRGNLSNKLINKLLPEDKKLPGYSYLSRGVDDSGTKVIPEANPTKVVQLYNKLGEKQQKSLFPDAADRSALNRLTNAVKLNQEALNLMFNPKTGQRNLEMGGLLGAGAATAAGKKYDLVGGALGSLTGYLGVAKGINSLLTSQKMRDRYLKSLSKQGQAGLSKLLNNESVKRLLPALTNASINN